MDISGLSSFYTGQTASQKDSALENTLKSGNMKEATDEELMDACRQFESYFVEQMYKAMLKTVPKSEYFSTSNETMLDFFKDKYVQELASDTSKQGNLGLAQMLYEQMKRNNISPEDIDKIASVADDKQEKENL